MYGPMGIHATKVVFENNAPDPLPDPKSVSWLRIVSATYYILLTIYNRPLMIYLTAPPMPPAPSLWLVVLGMFSFTSLLKFVLFRWCLDAVSMSHVLQFTVI